MHTYALTQVSDERLLADLAALVAADRQTMAMLLAHIAEVDARELFLPAACKSMHVYCMRVLHLSDDAAFKRIRAARTARRFPQLFEAVADGRLHLTAIVLLSPHFTTANIDELIAAATHKSKLEIEMLVARFAPRPDLPPAITSIVPPAEPLCSFQLAPEPPLAQPSGDAPAPRVTPLAPERFGLQVTISGSTRDKLERARALLRHQNPTGDLAEVLDRALDALLVDLERKKFGTTSRPRAVRARREDADPRYVPNDVRRAVYARDGEQCTFVSESGERCSERGFLELDHRIPVARDGQPTVDNLRTLCRAHNQYEAERLLGAAVVRAGRDRKRRRGGKGAEKLAAQPRPSRRGDETSTNETRANETRANETRVSEISAVESDVALALRGLGFTAAEIRRAMENTTSMGAPLPAASDRESSASSAADASVIRSAAVAPTFEQRIRVALAELTRSRAGRASEGRFDRAAADMYIGTA